MRTTLIGLAALLAGILIGAVGATVWRSTPAVAPDHNGTTPAAEVAGSVAATKSATPEYPPSGTYVFEDALGEAVVSYQLEFAGPNCRLTASGYQTNEDILCRTLRHSGILDVEFVADSGEGTSTSYDKGDTLFQLFYDNGKLVTNWLDYQPLNEKRQAVPAFQPSDSVS